MMIRNRRQLTIEHLDERVLFASDLTISGLQAREPAGQLDIAAADVGGDTPGRAYSLGQLQRSVQVRGAVGGDDSADWFRFDISERTPFRLRLERLKSDLDLKLYRRTGATLSLLGESRQSSTRSEGMHGTLVAGSYYVHVKPWQEAVSSYELTVALSSTATTSLAVTDEAAGSGLINVQRALAAVGVESWEDATGEGIVVAVIDTGVDYHHDDLDGNIWRNKGEIIGDRIDNDGNGLVDDIIGWDFANGDNNPLDQNGHGTHVAGIVAAEANGIGVTGVASDAQIMPIQVLARDGRGTDARVVQGIDYAVRMGADVINLSLGGKYSASIERAIESAIEQGVVVVVAAGNRAADEPDYPGRLNIDGSIVVGAVDANYTIAPFSNLAGPTGDRYVVAPGVSILSTYLNQQFAYMSGTSMAAPHVAALAARLLDVAPGLTPHQIQQVVTGTSTIGNVAMGARESLSLTSTKQTASRQTGVRRLTLLPDRNAENSLTDNIFQQWGLHRDLLDSNMAFSDDQLHSLLRDADIIAPAFHGGVMSQPHGEWSENSLSCSSEQQYDHFWAEEAELLRLELLDIEESCNDELSCKERRHLA